MGTLRTIFALSVVFAHSWPGGLVFVGGRNAVQLFYIISGFLISYVLVETKSYKSLSSFYINRYLRLYPIYLAVAILTLIAIFITGYPSFLDAYRQAPFGAGFLLVFSNLFLFGQDWVMFSGVTNGQLVFTSDFSKSDILLYEGLIAPQAWTLGVELTFYIIAPFVLPKRNYIFILLFLSLALRAYLIFMGLGTKDPWTYRFFPTELAFFLMGALAHQVLFPLYNKLPAEKLRVASNLATIFLITLSLTYFLLPLKELPKSILLLGAFLALIPLTFTFQNRYPLDNWIGNLSYPIYIGHVLVTLETSSLLRESGFNQYYISICCVIFSIAFAYLLEKYIGLPFEGVRKRIKNMR